MKRNYLRIAIAGVAALSLLGSSVSAFAATSTTQKSTGHTVVRTTVTPLQKALSDLVTAKTITAAQKTKILQSIQTLKLTGKDNATILTTLKSKGVITEAVRAAITTKLSATATAANTGKTQFQAQQVAKLVETGAFKNSAAAQAALTAFEAKQKATFEAQHKTGTSGKPVDATTSATKSGTDKAAQMKAMQAKRDSEITTILTSMVSAKTVTQAQANAMKTVLTAAPKRL